MLVSKLTKILGYEYIGKDIDISSIAFSQDAEFSGIAVCKNKNEIEKTKASVVLVSSGIYITDKTLVFPCDNLDCAMVRISQELIKGGYYPDYGKPVNYTLQAGGYYVGNGCKISDTAVIQPGAMIGDNVEIGEHVFIDAFVVIGSGTIINSGVQVKSGSKIGVDSFFHYSDDNENLSEFVGLGIVILHQNVYIGCNSVVQRGVFSDTIIAANSKIGNLVDIGHDVKIGRSCKIVSQVGIAGGAVLKDNVIVYGQSGINNDVVIGNNVIVKGKTSVIKSVEDNKIIFGQYGRECKDEIRIEAKIRRFFDRKDK